MKPEKFKDEDYSSRHDESTPKKKKRKKGKDWEKDDQRFSKKSAKPKSKTTKKVDKYPKFGKQSGRYWDEDDEDYERRKPGQQQYLSDKKKGRRKELSPASFSNTPDPKELIRLNKYIAQSGYCSRREADKLIAAGKVSVNGQIEKELGKKVKISDTVKIDGERLKAERSVYILMNKPKDCVTTVKDPHAKFTVIDLLGSRCVERVYPVGRLDRNTTGVLLLTNDGELTKKLLHPSYNKKKIYHVFLDKPLVKSDMQALIEGFELEDGHIKADAASYVDEQDKSQLGIELHSGRNRIVRRMFEHLGYTVKKLDRVYFAGLSKKGLGRGKWRYLNEKEVASLRSMRYA